MRALVALGLGLLQAASVLSAPAGGVSLGLDPSCASTPGGCTAAINTALGQCQGAPSCTITLAPGTYPITGGFRSIPLQGNNLNNVVLSGYGAEVVLLNLTGSFSFGGVQGLTVEGLTFDMERQPYSYGVAVAVDDTGFTLSVDASLYPPPGTPDKAYLLQAQAVLEYDPVKARPAAHAFDEYLLSDPANVSWSFQFQGGNTNLTVALPSVQGKVQVGQYYIVRHQVYSLNAFTLSQCSGVVFRDVTLYSAAGMGFYSQWVDGALLERVYVTRRPGRPMSITADAAHFNSCKGLIEIRDSVFEGQGDDGLNVHGKFAVVKTISTDRQSVTIPSASTSNSAFMGQVGDTLQFRSRATLQPYAFAEITSVDASTLTVYLNTSLPSQAAPEDLMEPVDPWTPSFLSVNNTYRNNRARGQLVKTHNVHIEACTYDGTSGPGVQADPDGCYWFETTPVANWTLLGNTFVDINYGPGMQGSDVYISACASSMPNVNQGQVHSNVYVTGNAFQQGPVDGASGAAALGLWATAGVVIANNTVTVPASSSAGAGTVGPTLFALTSCTDVQSSGNLCKYTSGTPIPC